MVSKSTIISEIDYRVNNVKTPDYSAWTIGVTDQPATRKHQHDDPKHWMQWNADSEQDARDIETHFKNKGMKGGTGGRGNADWVYIF